MERPYKIKLLLDILPTLRFGDTVVSNNRNIIDCGLDRSNTPLYIYWIKQNTSHLSRGCLRFVCRGVRKHNPGSHPDAPQAGERLSSRQAS